MKKSIFGIEELRGQHDRGRNYENVGENGEENGVETKKLC